MSYRFKILSTLVLITIFLFVGYADVIAQCPMCRMSAESNLKEGGSAGAGLNKGILYMLSLPYLLVGTLGFIWYRNRKKWSEEIYDEPFSDN